MKKKLILIIGIKLLAGNIYTNEEAYIIDNPTKAPQCPKIYQKLYKQNTSIINNKMYIELTLINTCKTKKNKIKIKITKQIIKYNSYKKYKEKIDFYKK